VTVSVSVKSGTSNPSEKPLSVGCTPPLTLNQIRSDDARDCAAAGRAGAKTRTTSVAVRMGLMSGSIS